MSSGVIGVVFSALVIVVPTAVVLHHQATTMPRSEGVRLVRKRTCEIANRCGATSGICDITNAIWIDLTPRRARIDRDVVDDCLNALDELERRHEACAAPPPPACLQISSETVGKLLEQDRSLRHDVDRAITEQLRR